MNKKSILLNQILEDIKNIPSDIQIIIEDNTLSDRDKIVSIAEDITYLLQNILAKL